MPGLIIAALAANVAFVLVALVVGEGLLAAAGAAAGGRRQPPSLQRAGAAVLAGLGGCALAGIPLAALHLFRWGAFAVCAVAILAAGTPVLVRYGRGLRRLLRRRRLDSVVAVCLLISAVVAGASWLAALAPPVADDELAYHLPEARTLADTHTLHLALHSQLSPMWDLFYGNLPTLLETLYGEALAIDGVPLSHALHFTLLVAFAVLAAGVVRELWGGRAAALAVVGIALYADLVSNSVTGLIDAGETSFEAGGMLLLALWFVRRDRALLGATGLLLGFAAATKYTALPAAAFAAVVVGAIAVRARDWRAFGAFAGTAIAVCAYWYGKNLVRFDNPFFPFLFGHPGLTAAEYQRVVTTVHYFGSSPRNLSTFATLPGRFATPADASAAVGFALAPFALLARGSTRAAALLLVWAALYVSAWFWLLSHENRFAMSALVLLIVLSGAAVGSARTLGHLTVALLAAAAFVVVARVHLERFHGNVHETYAAWLSTDKVAYTLGAESRDGYLRHSFGCQVDAVRTLERRGLRGNVGIYELEPPPELGGGNRLVALHLQARTQVDARSELRRQDVRFLLAPGPDPSHLSSAPAARPVLAAARPIWHDGGCWLFRLR